MASLTESPTATKGDCTSTLGGHGYSLQIDIDAVMPAEIKLVPLARDQKIACVRYNRPGRLVPCRVIMKQESKFFAADKVVGEITLKRYMQTYWVPQDSSQKLDKSLGYTLYEGKTECGRQLTVIEYVDVDCPLKAIVRDTATHHKVAYLEYAAHGWSIEYYYIACNVKKSVKRDDRGDKLIETLEFYEDGCLKCERAEFVDGHSEIKNYYKNGLLSSYEKADAKRSIYCVYAKLAFSSKINIDAVLATIDVPEKHHLVGLTNRKGKGRDGVCLSVMDDEVIVEEYTDDVLDSFYGIELVSGEQVRFEGR